MANEHALLTQKTFPISMTVANATGIEKGTLLAFSGGGSNTAAACFATDARLAGILYTEKVANDGNTQAAVLTGPGDELKAFASGAISFGDPVGSFWTAGATQFPNYLRTLSGALSLSGAVILGYSKENVTNGQSFKYVLNIQTPSYSIS